MRCAFFGPVKAEKAKVGKSSVIGFCLPFICDKLPFVPKA